MHLLLATAMAGTLALTDTVWFAEDDLVLERPGHRVELPSGYLFGVEADGEPVGVVFVGSGRTHTELSQSEAQRLGNHLVLGGDATVERMRTVVDDRRFVEDVDTVLILGLDAPAVAAGLREVVVDGGVVGFRDDQGVFQVVVTDYRLGASRRRATERLHDRQVALARHGLDPHDAIRMDRLEDRDRWVIDAHGDTTFHELVPDAIGAPMSRWTTWIEDPTGAVEEGHHAVWLAHGWLPRDEGDEPSLARLAGVVGDPEGARPRKILANVAARPHHSGLHTDVEVTSLVTYVSDDAARLVHLRVPCHEFEMRYDQMHVQRSCGLDRVTVDGREPLYVGRGFGRIDPVNEGGVYQLPAPIDPGGTSTLRVTHHDRLAIGAVVFGPEETIRRARKHVSLASPGGSIPDLLKLGPTTEAADLLPYAQRLTEPVDVELRAGLPEGRYQVAVSGAMDTVLNRGRDSWTLTEQAGRPYVVVGDFHGEDSFGGQQGMPAVRILARDDVLDADLQVLARATIRFFLDALPPFPHRELEIVQGTDSIAWQLGDETLPRPRLRAAPGQLLFEGIYSVGDAGMVLRSRWPRNLEVEMAEGVAAQWWRPIERPYAADDAWIGSAMPRLYAHLFLDHAYSERVIRNWRAIPRDSEGDDSLEEREAERIGRLFHGLVRARVGEEGLLRGLHAFLRREGRTTTELQTALEQVTGEDLSDVFDVWLRGDHHPELTAAWHVDGDELVVEMHTELPFGRIQVPVDVLSGRDETTHWVEVSDGRGRARLPLEGRLKEVQVDPGGLLPLSRVRVDEEGAGRAFAMVGNERG